MNCPIYSCTQHSTCWCCELLCKIKSLQILKMRATCWVWHREKANIKTLLIQGKGNLWSSENHRNSSYTASIARTVLSLAFETESTQLQGAGLPFAFVDSNLIHIKQNDLGLDKPCWDGFGWFLHMHIISGWTLEQTWIFFLGDYYFLPPSRLLQQVWARVTSECWQIAA